MKLKNKKTGEIVSKYSILAIEGVDADKGVQKIEVIDDESGKTWTYSSLADFIAHWEDYEEPKEYWTIDRSEKGGLFVHKVAELAMLPEWVECDEKYGIRFETEEEAEKAVEKLLAWKRLKEAGAEFYGWRRNQTGTYELYMRWCDRIPRSYEVKKDLDLLFGGEE